jgi:hypothetical protein
MAKHAGLPIITKNPCERINVTAAGVYSIFAGITHKLIVSRYMLMWLLFLFLNGTRI